MTSTLQDRATKARHDLWEAVASVPPELDGLGVNGTRDSRRRLGVVLMAAAVLAVLAVTGAMLTGRQGRAGPASQSVGTDRREVSAPDAGLAFTVPRSWTDGTSASDTSVTVASLAAPGGGLTVQALSVGHASADALAGQIRANLSLNHITATMTPDHSAGVPGDRLDWSYQGRVTAYVFLHQGLGVSFFFHNIGPAETGAVLASIRSVPRADPGWSTVPAEGLSLRVPQQWSSHSPTLPTAFGPVGNQVGFLSEGMTGLVAITPIHGVDAAHASADLQQQLRPLGAQDFQSSTASIGGSSAAELDFVSATQLGRSVGFPLAHRAYFVQARDTLLQIYLVGPDTAETRALFDAVAQSVTIAPR